MGKLNFESPKTSKFHFNKQSYKNLVINKPFLKKNILFSPIFLAICPTPPPQVATLTLTLTLTLTFFFVKINKFVSKFYLSLISQIKGLYLKNQWKSVESVRAHFRR